jgi:hypothetical protein
MTTNNEDTTITTTTTPRPATLANRGVVQLSTLDDVARLAKIAADSGLARVRTPAECAVILMTGAELGLSPMQSLRGIYVVEGRPTLAADTMVAVIRRSGVCDLWRTVESTAERCTIEAKRNDDDRTQSKTWTMADATRAGLAQKNIWKQYPAQMLRHRCASDLARELFSDVVLGLYDPEELDSATYDDAPATTAQEPQQRPANPLDGLGIEAPPKRQQNAAETPAQRDHIREATAYVGGDNPTLGEHNRAVAEAQTMPEAPAWRVALDALHEAAPDLAGYCNAVEALTLPGDAAPVWRSHRAAIGALSKEAKGAAWGAIVARVESLGQKGAATWLTKGVKMLDAAQTDAPAATEVQS